MELTGGQKTSHKHNNKDLSQPSSDFFFYGQELC